ncbi:uncharacterized protein UDID_11490 [Ustilago sp. UG-2017a]|nr:uncharacterized protein UDID_11490 [Ustilago sp. UG-2017a]
MEAKSQLRERERNDDLKNAGKLSSLSAKVMCLSASVLAFVAFLSKAGDRSFQLDWWKEALAEREVRIEASKVPRHTNSRACRMQQPPRTDSEPRLICGKEA